MTGSGRIDRCLYTRKSLTGIFKSNPALILVNKSRLACIFTSLNHPSSPERRRSIMNKAELIESIAAKANASKAATAVLLNATLEVLSEALARGDNVQLIGFGTFSVSERAARTGRNPQTGKEIKIAAKKVARFKAGTALSSALNKAQPAPAKTVRSKPGKNLKDSTK
jgi:DNA-binding protein HU-beta